MSFEFGKMDCYIIDLVDSVVNVNGFIVILILFGFLLDEMDVEDYGCELIEKVKF